jgi:ABC-2 type transport system ATP-binding protein
MRGISDQRSRAVSLHRVKARKLITTDPGRLSLIPNNTMPIITTEDLGRKYGERWAVRHLDFQIESGELFGLLGPNGAGKTTTMRMLASLIAPTTGRATVCGFDVTRDGDATEIRKRIGILTEVPGLYENLPVWQNLEFYAKLYDIEHDERQRRITRYLTLFGLWDQRNDAAGTLSKGMKQKLSMVRALLHEPQVVILDEPTSALDPEGAKLVRDLIGDLKAEGRTIILCTHNLHEAQSLCDRVAIIKRTLLRVGTPRDLQRALFGRQIEIRVANVPIGYVDGYLELEAPTMNDLAVMLAALPGVGDVGVAGDRLLVSTMDPEEVTPALVRLLVNQGAEVLRVAEVEHSLEAAYLDLVARYEEIEAERLEQVAVA